MNTNFSDQPTAGINKIFLDWVRKMYVLEKEMETLEKLEKKPVTISISLFILTMQLIEFQLRSLLFAIDYHLFLHNSSPFIKNRVRYAEDFKDLTLGQLNKKLSAFIGLSSKNRVTKDKFGHDFEVLKSKLDSLNGNRKVFVHKLYDKGSDIEEVRSMANSSLKNAKKALKNIDVLYEKLSASIGQKLNKKN